MTGRGLGLVLAWSVATTAAAHADAPLPPPATYEARSPNRRCVARADVVAGQVVVTPARGMPGATWTVAGWHRNIVVGNDCQVLGVGYAGGSLLDHDEREPQTPIMRFYRPGGPGNVVRLRVVRLGEVWPDLTQMPATVSHWQLYSTESWDGQRWTVVTADRRTLSFAP